MCDAVLVHVLEVFCLRLTGVCLALVCLSVLDFVAGADIVSWCVDLASAGVCLCLSF